MDSPKLRFAQSVDRFGKEIVVRIPDDADRRVDSFLEQSIGETYQRVLPASL
jgi:hypothetical protein